MKFYYSLKIPVKNYLKKYIYHHYKGYQRLVITKDQFIGRKIFDLLNNAKTIRKGGSPMNDKYLSFTVLAEVLKHHLSMQYSFGRSAPVIEEITFNISPNYAMKECGIWLTERGVIEFNEYVDAMFRSSFHEYMDTRPKGIQINKRIEEFIQYYKMTEEDLTFDMLHRDYFRYRSPLKTRKAHAL